MSQTETNSASDTASERVLVVPTALFRQLGYFQGFSSEVDRYLGELFSPEHVSYRPRAEVEQDPSFKQLIPYVIFRHSTARGARPCCSTLAAAGNVEGRSPPQAQRRHRRPYLGLRRRGRRRQSI